MLQIQAFSFGVRYWEEDLPTSLYKAISDKIQHVLDGLVTDDLNLLQLT